MKRETVLLYLIVLSSSLLVSGALLEHFAPSVISDVFGTSVNKTWQSLQFILGIAWVLFILFILATGFVVFLDEKKTNKKNIITLNDNKQIVLTGIQKKLLLNLQEINITFVFNSQHCGFEPFEEKDAYIKFAAIGSGGKEVEAELKRYVKEQLGKSINIEPGKSDRTRRWDRVIELRQDI